MEQFIAYGFKKLSEAEATQLVSKEEECWAVVYMFHQTLEALLACVEATRFTLEASYTDHATLRYIVTATDTSRKWQRWALKIRGYDFDANTELERKTPTPTGQGGCSTSQIIKSKPTDLPSRQQP